MAQQESFPKIRVLHQMGRTGGTLLSKCLATMRGVVLLSEIHPQGVGVFNPLAQALRWYPGLIEAGEADQLLAARTSFRDVMIYLNRKVQARGECLIIRDWSHLDFTGVPFIPTPSYRLTTAEVLAQGAHLLHMACVRHPIDQWLSFSRVKAMQGKIRVEPFMHGCRRFAEASSRIGFIRYEDFTRDADTILRSVCDRLEIDFDPGYRERWADYQNVTGDIGDSGSKLRESREIKPNTRGEISPHLLESLAGNSDCRRTCELLGYSLP